MKPMRRGRQSRIGRPRPMNEIAMSEIKRHSDAYDAQKRAWDNFHRANIAVLKVINARGHVKGPEERELLESAIEASQNMVNKARGALGKIQEFGFDKNPAYADEIEYLSSAIKTAKKFKGRYEAQR